MPQGVQYITPCLRALCRGLSAQARNGFPLLLGSCMRLYSRPLENERPFEITGATKEIA